MASAECWVVGRRKEWKRKVEDAKNFFLIEIYCNNFSNNFFKHLQPQFFTRQKHKKSIFLSGHFENQKKNDDIQLVIDDGWKGNALAHKIDSREGYFCKANCCAACRYNKLRSYRWGMQLKFIASMTKYCILVIKMLARLEKVNCFNLLARKI